MPQKPRSEGSSGLHGLDPGKLLGVFRAGKVEGPLIAGWTVTGVAGEGGSGVVWRAVREADGVAAAIKLATSEDLETLERIEQEIEALRALRHPHIVGLAEAGPLPGEGDEEGGLFLAMEYVEGSSLKEEIPSKGLEPERAYQWFEEMAGAVAYAHGVGILHRDLKPSNILLDVAGRVKVADFGLARPIHRRVHQLSLTRAGLVAGTAEYLPPEAYHRDYRPGPAADIYALGVILYEMLAGIPPRGAWSPVSSWRRVDVRVDEIVRKALDPEPARRWGRVEEMVGALNRVRESPARYSGTPMLTFPVRVADGLWTLLGLFLLMAGTSSLMHLNKSQVKLPFDLIGTHGVQTGGFQALFFLLAFSLPLGVWQLVRLWHFRGVPLREALPAPFGLRLGHSRMSAMLVGLTQLFCLYLPATHLLNLHLTSNLAWLSPGDPAWAHGLAMTEWDHTAILSPWLAPETGKHYWLWESIGPPENVLSESVDRLDFLPGYTPALMAVAGLLLGVAVLGTPLVAVGRWWRRERRGRSAVMVLCVTGIAWPVLQTRARALEEVSFLRSPNRNDPWSRRSLTRPAQLLAAELLDEKPGRDGWSLAADQLALYADQVSYRGLGMVERGEIAALRAGERMSGVDRSTAVVLEKAVVNRKTGEFRVLRAVEEWLEPQDRARPAEAALVTVELRGGVRGPGGLSIRSERLSREILYEAWQVTPTESEAGEWAEELRWAVAEPGPRLDALFHPAQEEYLDDDRGKRRALRQEMLAALRVGGMPESNGPVVVLDRLAGARTRIGIPLKNPAGGQPIYWLVTLVRCEERWQCVDLDFSTDIGFSVGK